MVEEEVYSATMQPEDQLQGSCPAPTAQSHVHHASCRVAVDATANLIPPDMLPGKGSCSASEQRLGKQASSSGPTDSWANEVIQVMC